MICLHILNCSQRTKEFGQTVNQLKNLVTEKVQTLKSSLEAQVQMN